MPQNPTEKPASKKPRRSKKWLIALGILLGLGFLTVLLAPSLLAPLLRARVEQAIGVAAEADGTIDSLSFGWRGHVRVGKGSFTRGDDTLEFSWDSIESDLSPLQLISGRPDFGQKLTIHGLDVAVVLEEAVLEEHGLEEPSEPETASNPSKPGSANLDPKTLDPKTWALPGVDLRGASFSIVKGDDRWTLAELEISTDPLVLFVRPEIQPDELFSVTIDTTLDQNAKDTRASGRIHAVVQVIPNESGPVRLKADLSIANLDAEHSATPDENGAHAGFSLTGGDLRAQLETVPLSPSDFKEVDLAQVLSWVSGQMEGTVSHAVVTDTELTNAHFSGNVKDGIAHLRLDPTVWNDGELQGSATLDAERWTIDLEADRVLSSQQLISKLAYVSPTFVYLQSLPAEVRCRLGSSGTHLEGTVENPVDSLTGTGDIAVSAGNLAIPVELEPLLELLHESDRKHLSFRAYSQPFEIKAGRILNKGFGLTSEDSPLWIEGYTTTGGALAHTIRLDKAAAKEFRKRVHRPEYKLAIQYLENNPIHLRGTVNDPVLELPAILRTLSGLGGSEDGQKPSLGESVDDLLETGLDFLKRGLNGKKEDR